MPRDWVDDYISATDYDDIDDEDECDEEIGDTLHDLRSTVAQMFDKETERRVREVERRLGCLNGTDEVYYASAIQNNHLRNVFAYDTEMSDTTSSCYDSDDAVMKPKPLFAERRVVSAGANGPWPKRTSSTTAGSSPRSMSSSFEGMSSSATSSFGSVAAPTTTKLSGVNRSGKTYDLHYTTTEPPPMPERHPARRSNQERTMFPPRRSSLMVRTDIGTMVPPNTPTTPTAGSFTPISPTAAGLPRMESIDQYSNLGKRASMSSRNAEQVVKRAKSLGNVKTSATEQAIRPTTAPVVPPVPAAAPYTKMWAPPAYSPKRSKSASKTSSPSKSPSKGPGKHFAELQRKYNAFQHKRLSFHSSKDNGSASPTDEAAPYLKAMLDPVDGFDFNFDFNSPLKEVKKDSGVCLTDTTPTPATNKRVSPPVPKRPQGLTLFIPVDQSKPSPTQDWHVPNSFGADSATMVKVPPSPAKSDILMLEIEDGLKALKYDDTVAGVAPSTPTTIETGSPATPTKITRSSSMRDFGEKWQKRMSFSFSSNATAIETKEKRNSSVSEASASPSWVTVSNSNFTASPSKHDSGNAQMVTSAHTDDDTMKEVVVDPNGLLSGPPRLFAHGPVRRPAAEWPRPTSGMSDASLWTTTTNTTEINMSNSSLNNIAPLRPKRSRRDTKGPPDPLDEERPRSGADHPPHLRKAFRLLDVDSSPESSRPASKHNHDDSQEKVKKPAKKKQKKEKGFEVKERRNRVDAMFEVLSKALEFG